MAHPETAADALAGATAPAHLATSVENRPHVAPVWYLYDDGSLYLFTSGRKLRNLQENPRVAASVEGDGWLVVLRGTATVVDDVERARDIGRQLFETYTGDPAGSEFTDEDGTPKGTLVEVDIGTVTLRED
ncbi:MAG: pyridoxamine 5'-phosphate oxidase family protein [Halovenus sp.]